MEPRNTSRIAQLAISDAIKSHLYTNSPFAKELEKEKKKRLAERRKTATLEAMTKIQLKGPKKTALPDETGRTFTPCQSENNLEFKTYHLKPHEKCLEWVEKNFILEGRKTYEDTKIRAFLDRRLPDLPSQFIDFTSYDTHKDSINFPPNIYKKKCINHSSNEKSGSLTNSLELPSVEKPYLKNKCNKYVTNENLTMEDCCISKNVLPILTPTIDSLVSDSAKNSYSDKDKKSSTKFSNWTLNFTDEIHCNGSISQLNTTSLSMSDVSQTHNKYTCDVYLKQNVCQTSDSCFIFDIENDESLKEIVQVCKKEENWKNDACKLSDESSSSNLPYGSISTDSHSETISHLQIYKQLYNNSVIKNNATFSSKFCETKSSTCSNSFEFPFFYHLFSNDSDYECDSFLQYEKFRILKMIDAFTNCQKGS